MIRRRFSTGVYRRSVVCFVLVLLLASLAAAQSTDPSQNPAPDQASRAAVVDQRSDTTDIQTETSIPSGDVPTAAQVTKDGERAPDPADVTTAVVKTTTDPLKPPQAPQAPAAPEPAKYDVTLIGHRNIGSGLNFYSIEREIALGQDLAKQVEGSTKLISDPEITEYVNRIGQNLVRNSDSRVPFTIKVIDSNEVNAFALPGGFFFVDSGLILAADSEAELAAVMAHEIAHVAARHATKNMTKQQIWNMASIPLMFVGGPAGYAIAELASIAVPLGFLKFSRDAEREADMLGLEYDYVAGYDPQAFIQFFERLKAEEKEKHSKIAKMFSTHPMTADRITAAQAEIKMYFPDRESYLVDTSEFDNMKARLMALQGGHRLDVGMGNMPVLRKHTQDTEPDISAPNSSTTPPDPNDSDRPTLKRTPANPD